MEFKTLTDLDAWFRKEVLEAIDRLDNYDALIDIAKEYKRHYDNLGGVRIEFS